jgi:hypothetical protein
VMGVRCHHDRRTAGRAKGRWTYLADQLSG